LLERVKKPTLQNANPTSLMVNRSFHHGCKPLIQPALGRREVWGDYDIKRGSLCGRLLMLLGELLSVFSLLLREFRMVCRLPTGCGICFPMARSVHGIRLRLDFSCSSSLSVRDAEIANLRPPL
jgi:hypothetical protein